MGRKSYSLDRENKSSIVVSSSSRSGQQKTITKIIGFQATIYRVSSFRFSCRSMRKSSSSFRGRTRLSTFFSGVSLLAMILLAGSWLKQIPMAALVAVMISIAVSTADINGLRNLRRIPKSDTSVMLMTFAVTMLTTPHNLALGVLAGVALAGILFSRKVAKVIRVESEVISAQERHYRVIGQLFFVSTIYFVQGFDLHDHPERISIDLSKAHIWDQSGVTALDQVIRKLRLGGSEVTVVGMNQETLDLFERIGGQESAHA